MQGPKLNVEQYRQCVEWAKGNAAGDCKPVRFLYKGQAMSLGDGSLYPKGSNVVYHPVYWRFTPAQAKEIAGWLDGVKEVVSE